MTFDAGSIEANVDIDRTPFQRGLALCRQEAEDFARQQYKVTFRADVDTKAAEAKIAALQHKLSGDVRSRLRVDVDTRPAEQALGRAESSASGYSRAVSTAKKDTEDLKFSLIDLAIAAGPGIIPLAGGMAGLLSAIAAYGIVVPLAIKGANREIANGTKVGAAYKSSIDQTTSSLQRLEATAARGVLKPFQQTVTELNRQAPQLDSLVAKLAGPVGSSVHSLADGILHLFVAAEPLIEQAVTEVGVLADKFDHWAQGPGGAKFFAALQHDLPIAVDAIGNIASVATKVIAALAPAGETVLHVIDALSNALNSIPQPVLTFLLTGLVAWRTYALLAGLATRALAAAGLEEADAATAQSVATTRLNGVLAENALIAARAAAAQGELAAAQLANSRMAIAGWGARSATGAGAPVLIPGSAAANARAAAAGGGSRMAGILPAVGKLAVRGLIAGLVADTLNNATEGWKGDTGWRGLVHGGLSGAKDFLRAPIDILTGHFGMLFNDVRNDIGAIKGTQSVQGMQHDYNSWAVNHFTNRGSAAIRGIDASATRAEDVTSAGINAVTGTTNLKEAADANTQLSQALQKRIESEQKLFATSKGSITLNNGLKVSAEAYQKVLARYRGEGTGAVAAANEFFQKHAQVLDDTTTAQQELTDRSANYSTFLSTLAVRYKVTTDQAAIFAKALGLTYGQITNTVQSSGAAARAVGLLQSQFTNGNAALQGWLAALSQINTATPTLTDKVALLGAGLQALRGTTLDMAGSNLQAASSAESAANAIEQNSKSVSKHGNLLGQLVKTSQGYVVLQPKLTAGALATQQAMSQAGTAAIGLAQSIYQNTGNADRAAAAYYGLRRQFIDTEIGAGRTRGAAKKLADQIYGIPDHKFVKFLQKGDLPGAINNLTKRLTTFTKEFENILVNLKVGSDNVTPRVAALEQLQGGGITIPVNIDRGAPVPGGPGNLLDPTRGAPNPPQKPTGSGKQGALGKAHGGWITEGTTDTADDVWIRASKDEFVVKARQARKHRGLLEAINNGTKGFAGGGSVGGPPSLITDPTSSAQDAANKKAANAAKAAQKKADQKYNDKINTLSDLLLQALQGLSGVAYQSAAQIKHATNSINADVKKVFQADFTDSKTVRHIRRDTNEIVREADRRDALIRRIGSPNLPHRMDEGQRLDAITQLRDSVRSAVLGRFDIGRSGNGYGVGIMASLTQDNRDAAKFIRLRAQAKKLGLSSDLIQQITEEGPEAAAANLQAIVAGGRGYVHGLNAQYSRYKGYANQLADAQTRDTYGATRAQEIRHIRHLMALQHAEQVKINKHLADVAHDVRDLDKKLLAKRRQG